MAPKRLRPIRLCLALALLASPAAAAPQPFASPEEAARALVTASRANDTAALRRLIGDEYADAVLGDGDPGIAARRKQLADAAEERLALRQEGPDRVTLVIGLDAYLFPIPLVRRDGAWQFDGAEGIEEILDRRVGQDELAAISVLRDYVGAQVEYASEPRDGTPVRQFAGRFLSTEGKRDGLYWDAGPNEEPSPFGPLAAERGRARSGTSYYGYHFRILTAQGPHAPGGAYSYVINGKLVAGFAAVAWPADYGKTGVKTFLVNQYGIVYQKDLGPDTATRAAALARYDPDASWEAVK
jgi:Protein of unknown function (DUF2950)